MSIASRKWARNLRASAIIFVIALGLVVLAHIAPECRTGRILLIADPQATDAIVRLTVQYSPLEGGGAVQKILWEGRAPKTPSILSYAHRSEGGFSLFVQDSTTGEWTRKIGGYIASPGETHVVLIGRDKVDYVTNFSGDFHRPQSSEAMNLISDAYQRMSDGLSCVDAGFAFANIEKQNRVRTER